MNIFIGNFSSDVTEDDLRQVCLIVDRVYDVKLIKDKYSGQSRGFGFVEMPAKREAEEAMEGIRDMKGRMVTVNEARPQADARGGRSRHNSRGGGRGRDFGQRRY